MRQAMIMLAALCSAVPAWAEDLPYTADMAQRPNFSKAYHTMTELPEWVSKAAAVSTPMGNIMFNGKAYLVGHLCKPHDCADNQLEVIFSRDGAQAWGLLSQRVEGRLYQMPLGTPDSVLLAAMHAAYRANNQGITP
ncbi:MAG: inhibitor of vertebrate lysozyme family protein [Acetobacter peroxydans]|jgi:hypothetical protein|nr:inhibitor of vertebrate lysozyme family protein [Acetobacter peroxydans]MCI2007419.1 inhibitor of vertebrate lysozyme family protein [Acetobacter peroxydans]MCI2078142.1 inhibitor of vertebrate lysozyme family protein [Acetobacter peroxydans]